MHFEGAASAQLLIEVGEELRGTSVGGELLRIQVNLHDLLCPLPVQDRRRAQKHVFQAVGPVQHHRDRVYPVFIKEYGLDDRRSGSRDAVAGIALPLENIPSRLNGFPQKLLLRLACGSFRVVPHDIRYILPPDIRGIPGDELTVTVLPYDIGLHAFCGSVKHPVDSITTSIS